MVIYPPLIPGDKIAIVAPAGWVPMELLEVAAERARMAGFACIIHPQCALRNGRFAGTDEQRITALHAVYADPSVKAIWCARGGYGAMRLLERLDYGLIASNPKPFIGLSDITALLVAIHQRTGQVTLHGRMAGDTARHVCPESERLLWAALQGEFPSPDRLPGYAPQVLVPGAATGKLIGGNLATLAALLGSGDAARLDHAILFIEEVNEPLYRLDRLLLQLVRAGLSGVRGIVVGGMTDMMDDAKGTARWDVKSLLLHHFGPLDVPMVTDYPVGHIPHQAVLPIGATVRLVAGEAVSLTVL